MALLDTGTDGTNIRYKEEDGRILLTYEHPDTKVLEKMNAEQAAGRTAFDKKGDMHHIMRIPQAILTKICSDTGLDFFNNDDAKLILNILKGPEYKKFRTYNGKI